MSRRAFQRIILNVKDKAKIRMICRTPGAANIGFLILVLVAQHCVPEENWLLALLVFAPPQIFLIPTLVLLFNAARKKQWENALGNGAVLLIAWPVLCGFSFALPHGPSQTQLRVMSYNIRYGAGGIGNIARLIQRENPDIICLQEVLAKDAWPDPFPDLKKYLPEYSVSRYGQLVTLSRWPIVSQKSHSLPQRDGCGILATQIVFQGKTLQIYNAHFINPVDGKLSEWPQQIQTRARIRRDQLQLLTHLALTQSTPYLIAGDFNTPSHGHTNRSLLALGQDAFASSAVGFGHTFPAVLPVLRIDRVFSSPQLQPQASRVLPARASDHRPLVIDFIVK